MEGQFDRRRARLRLSGGAFEGPYSYKRNVEGGDRCQER